MCYLYQANESEATQLIVRSDNKLATILLNIKLNSSFPVSRDGPKDISYVCIPNPPIPNLSSTNPQCYIRIRNIVESLVMIR